jgi:hypothetical protein
MKKAVATMLAAYFLIFLMVDPVYADIHVQVSISNEGRINLSFEITNIDSAVYDQISNKKKFNESTIIRAINASTGTFIENYLAEIDFDNETNSIKADYSFFNYIVEKEIDKDKNVRVFKIETRWRRFKLDFAENFSINFAELFSLRVPEWNRTENGYLYNSTSNFGRTIFEIVGPQSTVDFYVDVDEETVIFETAVSEWDLFINSPYIILLIVVVVVFAAFTYRKLRYG